MNKTDVEISETRFLLTQKDDFYIKLQDEFSQIKSGISLSDEKIRQSALRQSEAEERRAVLSKEIEISEEKVKGSRAELDSLKKVLETIGLDVSTNQKQYNEKEAQLAALSSKLAEAADRMNSLKAKLTDIQENREKLGTEHLGLKSTLAN
jgi:chromosome segregation ATPase